MIKIIPVSIDYYREPSINYSEVREMNLSTSNKKSRTINETKLRKFILILSRSGLFPTPRRLFFLASIGLFVK